MNLFCPDEILEQIAHEQGENEYEQIDEYKGQLMYFTLNGGFYGKSFFDAVMEQILTAGDLAEFDRRYIQNGFSGSVVINNKTVSVSDEEFEQRRKEYQLLGGIQKAGGIFYIEGDINTVDLAGSGAAMTEHRTALKEGLKDDIIEALGVPSVLVSRTRQGGFPNQDEIINSFEFYNGNTQQYRDVLAKQFSKIAEYFAGGIISTDLEIEPKTFDLGADVTAEGDAGVTLEGETTVEAVDQNAIAQATLRGSVGGVQGILSIQQSVVAGTTTPESATTILIAIYGFDEVTAKQILGI